MAANKKLNIVIWAFPSWHGNYTKSTVELAKELALRHNILYIDYAYTIKDIISPKPENAIQVNRILNSKDSIKTVGLDNGAKISVLSLPPILPFNWTESETIFGLIEKVNTAIVAKRINAALTRLNFRADIVINAFNPFFGNAIPKIFPTCPVIYYCYDNINASAWAAKHGGRLENHFTQNIDAAIFTSDALKENKNWNIPGYIVKNGVDLNIFNQVGSHPSPLNTGLNSKKIIGYVGTIDERLDFDMLEKLAVANPQFDFHFIGRVITARIEQLKSFSNVKFFGAVTPQLLPGMMQHFEAAIIPFVKNDFTVNIYPMKVNEYLALGIPVISTGFARLNDLEGFLEIADDAPTFAQKLEEVIQNNSELNRTRRKEKANTNSWKQKSVEFENILMHYVS